MDFAMEIASLIAKAADMAVSYTHLDVYKRQALLLLTVMVRKL